MSNRDAIRAQILELLIGHAKVAPAEIDDLEPFSSYGLGSVAATTIAGELADHLGQTISPLALFEYPSVAALADHLAAPGTREAARTPTFGGASQARPEPIAIVGLACRVPGAPTKDVFWQQLLNEADVISEVPQDRWTADEGTGRFGGFIDGVDLFDNHFFRIPANEAALMDPQQRLLLEVSWHALEDAGAIPAELEGSNVGVFVGASFSDYGLKQFATGGNGHALANTGNALAVLANRLSYFYDLRGPSITVDTACSSSLVSAHLAARAIRAGECELALVAGVNLLLAPQISRGLVAAGLLAPDGRCKPFAAQADGYARAEGCGVVVLKPLAKAQTDGDRIYAVIRGSAVNQDGRSNGLTAPNPSAQRAVLKSAYADADVLPKDLSYVECHGTGTQLGDRIEATALGEVLATGRDAERPCLIGSVKSNVGHLESAAGIVGLIKAALMLHNGVIPPTLHFTEPNHAISFDELGLRVAAQHTDLPGGPAAVVGVSSFGFGGTNAHLVLGAVPEQPATNAPDTAECMVLPVSARSDAALTAACADWADALQSAGQEGMANLAYTAAVRRTHHPRRLAVVGTTPAELDAALRVERNRVATLVGEPKPLFVFGGHGAQRLGMLRDLAAAEPLVASVLARCDEALADYAPWSLRTLVADSDERLSTDTAFIQPALCATQIAITALFRSIGVDPVAVLGHSVGEIAAAHSAGIIDLPTAMRLAYHRGHLLAALAGRGRMLAVGLPEFEAAALAESHDLDLAAVNSPDTAVLSGSTEALTQIADKLTAKGVFTRHLDGEYPFHSSFTGHAADQLAGLLGELNTHVSKVSFVSSVLGEVCGASSLDGAYWGRNIRDTVRFASGLRAALELGVDTVVEIGVRPALITPIRRTVASANRTDVAVLPDQTVSEIDEVRQVYQTLADLYMRGCDIRWERKYRGQARIRNAPPYPFERTKHWLNSSANTVAVGGLAHPLIGSELDVADTDGRRVWQAVLDMRSLPSCLADHRINGAVVLPATAVVEGAMAVAAVLGLPDAEIVDVTLHAPLLLDDDPVTVQWTVVPDEAETFRTTVHMRVEGGWRLHATATLCPPGEAAVKEICATPGQARARCFEQLPPSLLYQVLAFHGLEYGPAFRGVHEVWRRTDEAVGRISVDKQDEQNVTRLLDSAFHLVAAATGAHTEAIPRGFLPVGIDFVRRAAAERLPDEAEVTVALRAGGSAEIVSDITVFDLDGVPRVLIGGLRLRALGQRQQLNDAMRGDIWEYQVGWSVRDLVPDDAQLWPATWLILADGSGVGEALTDALTRAGHTVCTARRGTVFKALGEHDFEVDPDAPADLVRLYAAAGGSQLQGVVHLWSLDAAAPVVSVVEAIKLVSSAAGVAMPTLLVATRGAQPVTAPSEVRDPFGGTVWGLAKGIPFENPLLRFACLDLDPAGTPAGAAAQLQAELGVDKGDTEVGYRSGTRYVRRLLPPEERGEPGALPIREDGTYVITGGLGGLGALAARWLAYNGAGHVALLSRTAAEHHPTVAELRDKGIGVTPIAVDVADRDALAAALSHLRAHTMPIAGVFHLAGALADGPLLQLDGRALDTVFRPKVDGAWNLHELTAEDPLDLFVLYSSAASVLGSPGQSNYSAGNAFLDSLAAYRVGLGLPALAVSWGPWAEVGMAGHGTALQRRLRTAASAIEPDDGMAVLEALLRQPSKGSYHHVALPFDLRDLLQYYPTGAAMSFFEQVTDQQVVVTRSAGIRSSVRARPDIGQYVAPRNELERQIAGIWATAIGLEKVSVSDGFFELGGDSVFANQILIEINRALGVQIAPEEAFQALTVAGLAELAEQQMLERLADMSEQEAATLVARLGPD